MSEDVSKQRLRPFLEGQINKGEIEGLCWLNEEKTKFRIPWYHGGKPDWKPDHGQIFKEWAVHTGRYRECIDEPDWVGWKTRLRCALNKASDIVECKSENCTRAEESDPYKVYELKQRQPGKKKTASGNRATATVTDAVVLPSQGVPDRAPVPTFVNNFKLTSDEQIERMPSDLNEVHTSDLLPGANDIQVSQMSITEGDTATFDNLLDVKPGEVSNHLEILLYYSNNVVWTKHATDPNGCRIYYGDGNLANQPECLPVNLLEAVFGENQAETLWLPPVRDLLPSKMVSTVQTVLERGMERGVLLQCQSDGNVVAYRLCKCTIFYASALGTNGNPRKLPLVLRDMGAESVEPTLIFDYKNWFLPALNDYVFQNGPMPDPRVFLLIGSEKKLSEIDENVPIYATVASRQAVEDVKKISSAMAQVRQPVNVDDMVSEVKQMSLESIDMSTPTTQVPGYEFTPDPILLVDNFIDPDAMQNPEVFQPSFYDVNFDTDTQIGASGFPATVDASMWSQLVSNDHNAFDETDFSDLMVFPRIV